MTFIYVMPLHEEENGYGVIQNGGLPPDHTPVKESNTKTEENLENVKNTGGRATKFLSSARDRLLCKSCRKDKVAEISSIPSKQLKKEENINNGCFSCLRKKKAVQQSVRIHVEDDSNPAKTSYWNRLKCCGNQKIDGNQHGCLPFMKKKSAWEERRDSILSDRSPKQNCSMKCKNFMKKLFCLHLCYKKKKFEDLSVSRRASTLSKKKSLTPTSVPVEDHTPKLDLSLVEHSSHMRAAIPVLPISLAWFCLGMNCILPGTGTVFSGMFCLCFGKPRFSQKDSIRSRIGAFIVDCIVGFSQCFTILFCLVGWGWSIWWGVIMVKLARKYKKLKLVADAEESSVKRSSVINRNTQFKDTERGT